MADLRIACEPGGAHVLQSHPIGQRARTGDLQAVVEDHHARVVALQRVVSVRHRVDQSLEPREAWIFGHRFEPHVVVEHLEVAQQRFDQRSGLLDHADQWAGELHVLGDVQIAPGAQLGAIHAQHTYPRRRQEPHRIGGEQNHTGVRQPAIAQEITGYK